MSKQFSIVFNDPRGGRIEAMATRLGVKPEEMLCWFILEKLRELEAAAEGDTNQKE